MTHPVGHPIVIFWIAITVIAAFIAGATFGRVQEHERICRHYPDLCTELGNKP